MHGEGDGRLLQHLCRARRLGHRLRGAVSALLPLDNLASTYRSDFRIQNQVDQLKAPAARPSQPVPYESTAIFLRLRNRSISASIEPNRVPQLNTFGVRPLGREPISPERSSDNPLNVPGMPHWQTGTVR
jgi:hypothetical protein